MRSLRCSFAAAMALGLLCIQASSGHATAIDRVVGAVAPNGGAQLLKRFTPPVGAVVVGVEVVTNDLRTVFPRVALLQGPVESSSDVVALREARDVRSVLDKHRIRITMPPLVVLASQEIYVAVTLPAGNGVRAPGDGAALGAVQLSAPNGSFIAASDGTLQPIDVDLAVDLTLQAVSKAHASEDRAATPATFLQVGSANPTSGAARISFALERTGDAVLAIYDVSGRQVRTLFHGVLERGSHAREWDGRDDAGYDVATGVYLLRLTTAQKVLTQKLVIAR